VRGETVKLYQPIELTSEECCKCGVLFGLTSEFQRRRINDHSTFYCPSGHPQSYCGESPEEKAQRLLKEEQARHARTIARENEERIARERAERKLTRVEKGVCPECKRSFPNLARHMACKHKQPPADTRPKQPSEFEKAKARRRDDLSKSG
jgi:hypothetical protein